MEKNLKVHNDEYLTSCFVNYFISLKENGEDLSFSRIYTSFFTALGGLDEKYNSYEFVDKTKKNFEIIVKHLDKISQELYKEGRRKNGIRDSRSNLMKEYTTLEVAEKLNVSVAAITKAIREGRLQAHKGGAYDGYLVYENDFNNFKSSRKRK